MISFKTFLEAEVTPIVAEPMKADDQLLSFIRKNCSDSLWMFENETPIWRGDEGADKILGSDGVAIINTELSERSSQNSSNWYTLILDNHPKFKDFPKRSKSLICTTRYKVAIAYGNGKAMAVIPFNSAKIGWVSKPDIWDEKVNFYDKTFEKMNVFFDKLEKYGLNDKSWKSFIEFDKRLKSDEELRNEMIGELSIFGINELDENNKRKISKKDWLDHFLKQVLSVYDVDSLELLTPAQLKSRQEIFSKSKTTYRDSHELWVGGKVLCLAETMFNRLCEELS
jgi:hypothetical protein